MRIYFLGIGGTAMGNAAVLMQQAGHDVRGSDAGVYPPMSEVLAGAGITVLEGYDAARLAELNPDLVVVGNAMSRGNPEVEWLLENRRQEYVSLPELLGKLVLRARKVAVVAGTHGKTTTTALAATLLRDNGVEAGWLLGGVPRDLPAGQNAGAEGAPFVIEGDEYDSAFFDKRSKFVHYRPWITVLNNLEFDHADIFRDEADLRRSFEHLVRIVPRDGALLVNADDPVLKALSEVPWTRRHTVGTAEGADLRITGYKTHGEGSCFELSWRGASWGRVEWGLGGLYNARNAAMAALAAALLACPGDPRQLSLGALKGFQGVRRRQEVRWRDEQLILVEDFGHHPTAVRETLTALRERFGGSLAACFEPRSNTARTKIFEAAFTDALAEADEVYLAPVHRFASMSPEAALDTAAMAVALRNRGRQAAAFTDFSALEKALARRCAHAGQPLVVAFFSNGSFDGRLEDWLKKLRPAPRGTPGGGIDFVS
ncbi:MAG: Mur ligase [Puniceicoccaceae bacterium]|nr:MAG: Mur ligase [Puniceicoccaceae bacterium]